MKSVLCMVVGLMGLGISSEIAQSRLPFANHQEAASIARRHQRSVRGQTLTSQGMPAIRLKFDKAFKYAGSQEFILYDVAHAEQHFFVEADKEGRVKRFYWIQFEGYLPSNNHSHNYKANKTIKLAGLDFIADAYAININANPGRSDSDGNRARTFLESKGYRMKSNDVMLQRLVQLIDKEKRNELMIIYTEDLSEQRLTAADLAPDGRAASRWDEISKGLLERAVGGMNVLLPPYSIDYQSGDEAPHSKWRAGLVRPLG